jgi:hypothetical protein
VTVDEINLLVVAQSRDRDVVGLVLLPVARLIVQQHFDVGLFVSEFVEAVVAVMRRLCAHAAPDFDDIARRLAGAANQLTTRGRSVGRSGHRLLFV